MAHWVKALTSRSTAYFSNGMHSEECVVGPYVRIIKSNMAVDNTVLEDFILIDQRFVTDLLVDIIGWICNHREWS